MTKDNEPKFMRFEKNQCIEEKHQVFFNTSLQFSIYFEYLIFFTFALVFSQTNRLSFLSKHKP